MDTKLYTKIKEIGIFPEETEEAPEKKINTAIRIFALIIFLFVYAVLFLWFGTLYHEYMI
jgi:hypothetical protein